MPSLVDWPVYPRSAHTMQAQMTRNAWGPTRQLGSTEAMPAAVATQVASGVQADRLEPCRGWNRRPRTDQFDLVVRPAVALQPPLSSRAASPLSASLCMRCETVFIFPPVACAI